MWLASSRRRALDVPLGCDSTPVSVIINYARRPHMVVVQEMLVRRATVSPPSRCRQIDSWVSSSALAPSTCIGPRFGPSSSHDLPMPGLWWVALFWHPFGAQRLHMIAVVLYAAQLFPLDGAMPPLGASSPRRCTRCHHTSSSTSVVRGRGMRRRISQGWHGRVVCVRCVGARVWPLRCSVLALPSRRSAAWCCACASGSGGP